MFNQCVATLRPEFDPVTFGHDNVMFNFPPQSLRGEERRDFMDVVMLVKHVLYRLKFRHDPNSIPSARRVLIIIGLDLEKAVLVRNFLGKYSTMLQSFLGFIKSHVGF